VAGCGDDGGSGADAMVSASCLEADDHSDLPWIQENILTPSCAAFTACHRGSALSAEGLNLEDGMSEDNLVDIPSELFPDFDLVVPGDPMNSYLMIIIGQFEGPLGEGGTMPFNNPLLCKQKRDALGRWINGLSPGGDPDAGPSTPDAGPGTTDAAP
jgi:hypothetical protein